MLTKKEFLQQSEMDKIAKDLKASAILTYVCAGVTAMSGFASGNVFIILDVALMVGLALGIQFAYSRGCAIGLTFYSVISMLIGLIVLHKLSGWLVLVAGICGIKATNRFRDAWNWYTKTGEVVRPEKHF